MKATNKIIKDDNDVIYQVTYNSDWFKNFWIRKLLERQLNKYMWDGKLANLYIRFLLKIGMIISIPIETTPTTKKRQT